MSLDYDPAAMQRIIRNIQEMNAVINNTKVVTERLSNALYPIYGKANNPMVEEKPEDEIW